METLPSPGIANKGFRSTDPELAAVDASVRGPVMICFLTAVHWMVVGTVLLVYASALSHPQDAIPLLSYFNKLSAHCSFFTYGRVYPAAVDALVYGWASTAGLGLATWLIARMGRVPVAFPAALIMAVVFWNLGVGVGLTGIFVGDSTGVELLEFPTYAAAILWVAYAIFAVCIISTYLARKPGRDALAQAWLLVALFAFPWLYATGSILLSSRIGTGVGDSWINPLPGSGVMQEVINAWFVHGIFTLWLAPLGLGLLYYLIPKMSGLPIRYAGKAQLAFWTWLVFAPWTAVHDLVGGPFPSDMVTMGLVFSGLIFIPVALIGLNLVGTAFAAEEKQGHHGGIVFPFLVLAAMIFVVVGITEQLLSVRSVNEVLRFTMFRDCNLFLWVFGFFSFVVFGSIYYIVPRLLDFGWRSALLIKIHYYTSVYGILLMLAMLGFGGIMQGLTLENPDSHVTIAMAIEVAHNFSIAATMCISLLSLGNGVFALHLGWMLLDWLRQRVRANRLAAEILFEPYEEEVPVKTSTEVTA